MVFFSNNMYMITVEDVSVSTSPTNYKKYCTTVGMCVSRYHNTGLHINKTAKGAKGADNLSAILSCLQKRI